MHEHMFAHISDAVPHGESLRLRRELLDLFLRHPFTIEDLSKQGWDGVAWLETGAITLNRALLNKSSSRALNVYLHEVAHVRSSEVHTVDFAVMCAGLQRRFHCHDVRSAVYDTHEAVAHDRRSFVYRELHAGRVFSSAVANPDGWLAVRRAAREHEEDMRLLLPSLVALGVAVAALAVWSAWPWLRPLAESPAMVFCVGLLAVVVPVVNALR